MQVVRRSIFEVFEFCSIKKFTDIFFCENNKYSVYSNLEQDSQKIENYTNFQNLFGIKTFHLNSKDQ